MTVEDDLNDVDSGVDFTSISITNDTKYLYIKFETSEDIDLLEILQSKRDGENIATYSLWYVKNYKGKGFIK